MIYITYLILDFVLRGFIVVFVSLLFYFSSDIIIDKLFKQLNKAYSFVAKTLKIRAIKTLDNILLGFFLSYTILDVLKN